MNKEVLATALAKLRDFSEQAASLLNVEEAATLHAFVTVRRRDADGAATDTQLLQQVEHALAVWAASNSPMAPEENHSGEKRGQLRLRMAIERLQAAGRDTPEDDESLELVQGAYLALDRRSNLDAENIRLRLLLGALVGQVRAKHELASEMQEAVPDWPEAQRLAAGTFFVKQPLHLIRNIAGVEVSLRARRYEVHGDIVLEGDVPDDALLVVHDGALRVDGYIFGHVCVSGDIWVENNVQGGYVISTTGNVHIQRILAQAIVIAKQGCVECQSIELARRVFGWHRVYVADDVLGGEILGRDICIDGTVTSSHIHAVGAISAQHIVQGDWGAAVVRLRTSLSGEDYGQPITTESRRLQFKNTKMSYELRRAQARAERMDKELHDAYVCAFYSLSGGVKAHEAVQALRGIQAQCVLLERLLSIAENLLLFCTETLELDDETYLIQAASLEEEYKDELASIKKGVARAPKIPPTYHASHRDELTKIAGHLETLLTDLPMFSPTGPEMSTRMASLHHYLKAWREQFAAWYSEFSTILQEFNIDATTCNLIELHPGAVVKLVEDMLSGKKCIDAQHKHGSAFLELMRKNLGRAKERRNAAYEQLEKLKAEARTLPDALAEKASLLVKKDGDAPAHVQAERFGEGVTIVAGDGLLDEKSSFMVPRGYVGTGFTVDDGAVVAQ